MPPWIASVIFTAGIAGLFYLDRDRKKIASKSLWIPTIWLFFSLSRSLSAWLGLSPVEDAASISVQGSPVDAALFEALELLALFVVLSRRQRIARMLRNNWPICLFFFYAALSISWSDYPFVTLKHWIKGVGDVMMILIVLTELRSRDAIERLFTRLGFVLLPLSVLFIKYYPQLGRSLTLSWNMDPVGVATQKNSLGELCDILGLALLWRFRSAYNNREDPHRRRRLTALGAVLGMVAWMLWQCNSMTSISACSMASAVMWASNRPSFRRRPALVHLLAGAVPALSSYALFFQTSGNLVQNLGRNSSLTGRTDIWQLVMNIPAHRLLGTGYETFWLGSRLQRVWDAFPGEQLNEAHNGFIEILINLGWIGGFLLGILIMLGYFNIIRGYRRDPEMGSLKLAFFLSAIVTGFTEAAFRMVGPLWLVFLLATAAVPASAGIKTGRRDKGARLRPTQITEDADFVMSEAQPDGFSGASLPARTGAVSNRRLGERA